MKGLPEYQKAYIGPYKNGHMELKGGFYVPFNPSEISIDEAIGVSDVSQAGGTERMRWMRAGRTIGIQHPTEYSSLGQERKMATLSVTLFFNTLNDLYQTSYEDVRDDIRKLYPYTNTTEKIAAANRIRAKTENAQQIYFFWGTIAVAGTLKRMSVNYTMFAPDGKPVRAQVSITIEGFYVGEENVTTDTVSIKVGDIAGAALSGDLSNWKENYSGSSNPRKRL